MCCCYCFECGERDRKLSVYFWKGIFDINKCSVKGAGYPFAGFCTRFGILILLLTVVTL